MTTRRRESANDILPSPFPESWYFVTSRKALQKAKLIRKTWTGENIVAWCDDDGRVCVAEAYCPHLDSYLGTPAGGGFAAAASSVPYMAMSTMQPASAPPLPMPTRPGPQS